ncbi:MAG: hypothetical protein M3121_08350, partial [Chloroflexota bacterium]|nr:hypothetical protein [Chloroflexota bacterium]
GRLAITWTNTSDGNGNVSTVIVDPRIAPVTTRGTIGADVYVGSEYAGDVLAGHRGNDTFIGSLGADTMEGGEGIDTISYQYAKTGVRIVLWVGVAGGHEGAEALGDFYTSMENAIGSAYDDNITGNLGANRLQGGKGNDSLSAGQYFGDENVDTLEGGSGNDEYYVDTTTDQVIEGTGTGTGNTLANRITGNDGANTLRGDSGNDSLNGGDGSDRLEGGTGNDTFYVDRSSDSIVETSSGGTDRLYVGVSYTLAASAYVESMATNSSSGIDAINLKGNNIAQTITGNAGTNTLTGLGGNDVINGGSGSDRVYGGTGNDVLYGGGSDSKRDTFVFNTTLRSNVDTIKDFSTRYDRIELDNDVFTRAGSVGGLKSDAFVSYSRARDREDRIVYDKATGALYYDQDGTGSAAQVKFAQLAKNLAMNYADFIVIG